MNKNWLVIGMIVLLGYFYFQETDSLPSYNSDGLCGNGICESNIQETPYSCLIDCKHKVIDIDSYICMPLMNCGNWKESWFIYTLFGLFILVGLNSKYKFIKPKKKFKGRKRRRRR